MTNTDSRLSPSELFTDQLVQALDAAPPAEWEHVLDRFVRQYPDRRDEIFDTLEFHRQLAAPGRVDELPRRVLAAGERLGAFTIVQFLARGGMGEVYVAVQDVLNRRVALKVIRRGFVSPAARVKFLHEQQLLARLHQSNIVPVHFAGEEGTLQYCVMHLVKGVPLDRLIARLGPGCEPAESTLVAAVRSTLLAEESNPPVAVETATPRVALLSRPASFVAEAVGLIVQVADAIHHGHEQGICHRDLKPSNLILDEGGKCWVLDYGLAGALAPTSAEEKAAFGGTPQYMPAEQFDGATDRRSDVYSLGLVLYELLALRPAFDRGSWMDVRAAVSKANGADVRATVPDVPADVAAIVRKATAKNSAERYPTAAALADDLRRWQRSEPTVAFPRGPVRRLVMWARKHPARAAAVASSLALFLAVCVALVLFFRAAAAEAKAQAEVVAAEAKVQAEKDRRLAHAAILASIPAERLDRRPTWGWFDRTWQKIRQAAEFQADEPLRTQAVASMQAMDATLDKRWLNIPASSVAFGAKGRLVWGGSLDRPGSSWAGDASAPVDSGQKGPGPVVVCPDGRELQLAVTPENKFELALRDMTTGKLVRTYKLPGSEKPVPLNKYDDIVLALSPDGRYVAGYAVQPDRSGRTCVWEVDSGKEVQRLTEKASCLALAVVDKKPYLLTGDIDGRVTIREVGAEKPALAIQGCRGEVSALAVTHTPRHTPGDVSHPAFRDWWLAVGGINGHVAVWDLGTAALRSICQTSSRSTFALAFSPDTTLLVTAGREHPEVFDAATGRIVLQLANQNYSFGASFHPDGKHLAVGGREGILLYELIDGHGCRSFRGLEGAIEKTYFSNGLKRLAAVSQRSEVAVWDMDGRLLHLFQPPVVDFSDNIELAFGPDDRDLVVSGKRTAIRWDLTTGDEKQRWDLPLGLVDKLIYASEKELYLFRCETTEPNEPPYGHNVATHPRVLAFRNLLGPDPLKAVTRNDFAYRVFPSVACPKQKLFVVPGATKLGDNKFDRRVKAFDAATGEVRWEIESKLDMKYNEGFQLDQNGTTVHGTLSAGTVSELNNATGRTVRPSQDFRPIGPVDGYAVGPEYHLTDRKTDTQLFLPFVDDRVLNTSGTFRSGNRFLAWGTNDGTVRLLDIDAVEKRLGTVGLGWKK